MRKVITMVIAVFAINLGLADAATIIRFTNGDTEAIPWLKGTSYTEYVNLSLPADCHVRNASMNVACVPPDWEGSDCPENLKITLNGTTLFSFNGTNAGGFGKQTLFNGSEDRIRFHVSPGQRLNTSCYLPRNAVLLNATMDVSLHGGDGSPIELMNMTTTNDNGGPSVARAGDFNGDGHNDFMIASNRYTENQQDPDYLKGAVHLFYGNDDGCFSKPDLTFIGVNAGDWFGSRLDGVGDVNGDGYDDILIGAWGNDRGGLDGAGAAYLYFGGNNPDTTADRTFRGEGEFDFFGYALSAAGDVNGDGFTDFLVGAPGNARTAYLFLGGNSVDSVPDAKFSASTEWHGDSHFLSGAGDLNGDGYDDFIIGHIWEDSTTHVYFGGQNIRPVSTLANIPFPCG